MKRIIPALLVILLLQGCSTAPVPETSEPMTDSQKALTEPDAEAETETKSETESETLQPTASSITDTEPSPDDTGVQYDIWLRASNTEIVIGRDDSEIIWYAEVPVDCKPQVVYLMDADTGEKAAELFDEADYEKYGDTIKGDSVYNCRFTLDTDFGTDPEVSEERYYHYYVEFTEKNVTHRSKTTEIWVLEPFADKELDDMEAVDEAISALMESAEYQGLDDNEKLDKVVSLLKELAANGTADRPHSLIQSGSIVIDDDVVSFQYACGVGGGIKIKPFDEHMN